MRTIFISILSGIEAKAILHTDILKRLLGHGNRVVLFLKSNERAELYKREFSHPHLIYEVVSDFELSYGDRFFEFLKNYLVRTETLFLHKKVNFIEKKNHISYAISGALSYALGWGTVRKCARFFDRMFVRNNSFSRFFDAYRPELVFLANLFDPAEVAIVRESRKRSVPVVGFVNSWDKITSKGHVRILPDALIVPNELVKQEALEFLDVREGDVFVSGVPHYDHYVSSPVLSRDEFFKSINADPRKELILFAPMGSNWSDSDWDMIDHVDALVRRGAFKKSTELLVRFPPNDFAHKENIAKRPHLRCDVPGTRFQTKVGMDWDMSFSELNHLRNTLHHSALVLGYSSSIGIDAAVFKKPVINIAFTIKPAPRGKKDPIHRYTTTHYKKALASGGIRLVHSPDELVRWVDAYLDNPRLDEEGRARLVREQCYMADGKAGERIANFLLNYAAPL